MRNLETLKNEFGFNSLLLCMLWADGEQVEQESGFEFDYDSIHESVIDTLKTKYDSFIDTALTILPPDLVVDWEQMGHDFWLTCKGHGSGFWDREELTYNNVGNQLTKVCESIYLGDLYEHNGNLHID
ncbi:hypothetical protein VPLG_00137 [Vibrio phage eugene 12A10]|uniref:hypothetical protein n=1 Tax=Vibrio phage eugene 12A10 TaxID=573172 RepID=UPI000351E3F6|nr:hypothetical protein VPLG_00137 [Vibrio phage eugene 12A10]AGN51576.1 hypothetical protein VPLG_00137 [Vibrio phage eugene 12A10]